MKIIIFLFLALIFNSSAFAEADIPKKEIIEVVQAYSKTIGCLLNLEEKNIVRYNDGNNENQYVVLFTIDPECSGGSAMAHSALVVVTQEDYRGRVFIKPAQSFPVATNNLPQYSESIFIQDDNLWYTAKEFNWEIDALCCPSIEVKGKLTFKSGKWEAEPISTTNTK
ncbi:MAG: hypothetical protein P8Y49_08955 [Sulfurovaceae bacterium]